jgi:hypothetical protein
LAAYFPQFDHAIKPSPFETLSSDVITILVEFVYTGVLPKKPSVDSLLALKSFCDQRPEFFMLSDVLRRFLKVTNKKTRKWFVV